MNGQIIWNKTEVIPAKKASNGWVYEMSYIARRTISLFTADFYGKGERTYVTDSRYRNGQILAVSSQYPLETAPEWIQELAS